MKSRHAKAPSGRTPPLTASLRARCLARRLERLAGTQQRLRRDAGPVVALAPDELALDDRHPQPAVRQVARAMLPRRPGADDDDFERSHDAAVVDAGKKKA